LGLCVYKSGTPGVGGRLKTIPEDFVVEEVTEEGVLVSASGELPRDLSPGPFTHFTLVKRNWDTMRAVKEISRGVSMSQKRFSYAGTKDKHAVTSQRVSVSDVSIEKLASVRMKDVTLKDYSYADHPLALGDLWGNKFTVTVRCVGLSIEEIKKRLKDASDALSGGFPNFFGLQRFGTTRPITHLVGRHMLSGDFEEAFLTYLTYDSPLEDASAREARRSLHETRDFKEALKSFPVRLGYEYALLNHVAERPGDFRGAFMRLPRNLTIMFVHAFQSYVYNKALSECIKNGLPVERLPLVGYDSQADEISRNILETEGVSIEDFRVKEFSKAGSKGGFRDCFVPAHDLSLLDASQDDLNPECMKATLSFRLPKGSYATVLLREFMKNEYWRYTF
jgi:tRNA pseudouridine13 synthase